MTWHELAAGAIVRVGTGRGFIVGLDDPVVGHIVVTAAHCLPELPPADGGSYTKERTFENLLGRLGDQENRIWVECLFADPVADIAVLVCPDNQALPDEADAYEQLMESATPMMIADVRALEEPGTIGPQSVAFVYSLEGQWLQVLAGGTRSQVLVDGRKIAAGMSGSPIVDDAGRAIGVAGDGPRYNAGDDESHRPQPRVPHCLPFWLARLLVVRSPTSR